MAEDVVGVVAGLDLAQPGVLRVAIRLVHAILALAAEVVDVHPVRSPADDSLPDAARCAHVIVVLRRIGTAGDRQEVDERIPMPVGRVLLADPANGAAHREHLGGRQIPAAVRLDGRLQHADSAR